MTSATRLILILMLALPGAVAGQEVSTTAQPSTTTTSSAPATTDTSTTAAEPAAPTPAATNETGELRPSSYEIRNRFSALLRRSAPELTRILVIEPSLLSNEAFVAQYPELQRFVERHPEIRQHARFYLAEFEHPRRESGPVEEVIEPLLTFAGILLLAFALAWLVRTVIEQRRWSRLSRTQNEVHNKILDRFGTSAELLEYIKSPAGTKFLESAPIPLRSEPVSQPAPLTRVVWSIQAGVVVATAALGMLLVSLRYSAEAGQGLFAMGMIGLCVGLGFIGSAAVSLILSRRLGLWPAPPSSDRESNDRLDERGFVK